LDSALNNSFSNDTQPPGTGLLIQIGNWQLKLESFSAIGNNPKSTGLLIQQATGNWQLATQIRISLSNWKQPGEYWTFDSTGNGQ
jgi:hypothetical protein